MDLFGNIIIRSLPLQQPFASLIRHGKIETRTWNTHIRGRVLIYSTKKAISLEEMIQRYCDMDMVKRINKKLRRDHTKDLLGYALAVVDLVDVRLMTKKDEADCYINYKEGVYCHIYQNLTILDPFEFSPPVGTRKWGIVKDQAVLAELTKQGVYCGPSFIK